MIVLRRRGPRRCSGSGSGGRKLALTPQEHFASRANAVMHVASRWEGPADKSCRGNRASCRQGPRRQGTCRSPAGPRRRRRGAARSARARRCRAQDRLRASSISRSSVSIGSPRAPRSSAMRLVLPLGSTATGGGLVAEMPAIVELGQRRLDRAVAAVDGQHLRPHAGDDLHRLADLARVLDLIVEDVRVVGAIFADARQLREIAGRFGVGQQGDARPRCRGPARPPAPRARLSRGVPSSRPSQRFRHEFTGPVRYRDLATDRRPRRPAHPSVVQSRPPLRPNHGVGTTKIAATSALIDRYLARSIAVPLIGSLILAAMLLVLDKMLRLFQYVVDAGGPVSVVWRMLANLLPEYLVARHSDRADARHPARLPQARFVVGAGCAARHRHRLRPAAARALMPTRSRSRSSTCSSSAISSPTPITATKACASTCKSGALGAAIKVGEFNRLGKHLTLRIDRSENKGTQLHGIFVADGRRQGHDASPQPPSTAASFRPTIPTPSCSGWTKGRLVQDSPKFATPRTLAFDSYDLAGQPAGDRPVPPPRRHGVRRALSPRAVAARLWRRRPNLHQRLEAQAALQLPPGRSGDDVDAAAAGGRAGRAAQAKHVRARNLPRDPDRRRLSQGQSICGGCRRPTGRSNADHRACGCRSSCSPR